MPVEKLLDFSVLKTVREQEASIVKLLTPSAEGNHSVSMRVDYKIQLSN